MRSSWQHLFWSRQALCNRILIWMMAEIVLNLVGIDDLADYSEFLFDRPITEIVRPQKMG